MNIDTLRHPEFNELPLVIEGESKEVRYAGDGEVIIRLKPTIYSYTHNRAGEIPDSDRLRLKAIQKLVPLLQQTGIAHTYRQVNDRWIRSQLVLQPPTATEPSPFRPDDMSVEEIEKLPVAPPVEVVVKQVHSGTPKHRYFNFDAHTVRASHPSFASANLEADEPYPEAFVRFDWRNPMVNDAGVRLADEVLPEPMADWFIDTSRAAETAMRAYKVLSAFLGMRQLALWDICFFIAEDGETMFGEVSPDCLRVRAADGGSLDKDIWRHGGSSESVLAKWQSFTELLEKGGSDHGEIAA